MKRAASGTITIAVLVLLFGNPWIAGWLYDPWDFEFASVTRLLLSALTWPRWDFEDGRTLWHFVPGYPYYTEENDPFRHVLAVDLRALLLIGLVAMFIVLFADSATDRRGGFVLGWASVMFGAAGASFLAAFALPDASFRLAVEAGLDGTGYGLALGWVVGLATRDNRRILVAFIPIPVRRTTVTLSRTTIIRRGR